jgi:hypothetical protein
MCDEMVKEKSDLSSRGLRPVTSRHGLGVSHYAAGTQIELVFAASDPDSSIPVATPTRPGGSPCQKGGFDPLHAEIDAELAIVVVDVRDMPAD